ncbi:MAG TPA: hypothetical protein VIQ51_03420 [Chryseosolibacter sp.]
MSTWINLIEETAEHFQEGARSVRAYTDDTTYIITKDTASADYIVTTEEPGFPKRRTKSLEEFFNKVFGIEAKY